MLVDIHYRYTDTITYRYLISKDHYQNNAQQFKEVDSISK